MNAEWSEMEWLICGLTHPLTLALGSIISFVLWMPYGIGYYGFPWQDSTAVLSLLAFVMAFPACATRGLIRACHPRFLILNFVVAAISLFVGLHGLLHMLDWWLYVVRVG